MRLFFKPAKRGDLLAHATVQGQAIIALYDQRRSFVARRAGLSAVPNNGFVCSGGMCQMLAFAPTYRKSVSAGRAPVQVADRLGQLREQTRPSTVYCRPAAFASGSPSEPSGWTSMRRSCRHQ